MNWYQGEEIDEIDSHLSSPTVSFQKDETPLTLPPLTEVEIHGDMKETMCIKIS